MNKSVIVMAVIIAMSIGIVGNTNAFASHGSSPAACEADGYEAGREGPFSQELYETCGEVGGADAYYEGFIEGCMSVGNTEETCEQATDAE
jgi:hypothetical protein